MQVLAESKQAFYLSSLSTKIHLAVDGAGYDIPYDSDAAGRGVS